MEFDLAQLAQAIAGYEMEIFDTLPPRLRAALRQSPVKPSAILGIYTDTLFSARDQGYAEAVTIKAIKQIEQNYLKQLALAL